MNTQLEALLSRYDKAVAYMDCYHLIGEELAKAVEERQKYIPNMLELIREINSLMFD